MRRNAVRRLLGPLAAGLFVLTSTLSSAAPPVLVPEDLGVLDGETSSTAWYINRNGQVTGTSGLRVFSWTEADGIVYVAGSPTSGLVLPGGINDSGQVVGTAYLNYPQSLTADAFSWTSADGLVILGTLGGSYAAASAVNNTGQVVGQSFITGDFAGRAFLWTAATGMQDLGDLPGSAGTPPPGFPPLNSGANAVNDSGQVVGWTEAVFFDPFQGFTFETRAFLWTQAAGKQDLGTLGGGGSFATAVNESGQVIGWSSTPASTFFDPVTHAFLWTPGAGMRDLGTLPGFKTSIPSALNSSGQVVGWSTTAFGLDRAFLWTESGGMVDLGTLGGSFARAHAINDDGYIVGESTTRDGEVRAFLWTPTNGMVDLGALNGFNRSGAFNINQNGQIIGSSHTPGPQRATLWRRPTASPTQLTVAATGVYGATATLTATLTTVSGPAAGQTVAFSLNGNPVGSATTAANGVATFTGISLAGVNAGSYPGAVTATFAGADGYLGSIAQGALTVAKANQSIDFAGAPSAEIVGNSFVVTATTSSGLPVAVAAAGACSISELTVTMSTPTGVCSLTADQPGDTNYHAAPQATQTTAANYNFKGFFAPVENTPAVNSIKAGSAVSLKFSLTGNQTLAILDGTPVSAPITCGSAALVHPMEDTAGAGSSGLSYDASTDRYVYVWKTDKTWEETCRQLVIKLADGTLHRANFKLSK